MSRYNSIETPEVPAAASSPAGTSVFCGAVVEQLTRIVVVQRTEIRCQARHPEADRNPRYRGKPHGKLITEIPFLARFTGRVVRRCEHVFDGMLPARCPGCGLVSEYEIVAPVERAS